MAVGSLRVVFAIWAVAASTDMMIDGGSGEWMSWWKACWSACERCFGVDCLSRPPCGGNGIGESWLGSYVPKILLSVMVKVVVIELTVVDDER